ncbi:MAG TPA: hypothetical protein PKL64_00595 [Bacteroidales bacterium]|nr:hypothetical protein [Bacteroidales bacterium]
MEEKLFPEFDKLPPEQKPRELFYSFSEDGKFQKRVDIHSEAEQTIIQQSWDVSNERTLDARQRVKIGKTSPLEYYMERKTLELGMLAKMVGFPKWKVRRHFKPRIYKRLKPEVLQKYADVFGIKPEELNNVDN